MPKSQVYKILVFGECGVGKSTLNSQCFKELAFMNNESAIISPKETIGVSFYHDTLVIDGSEVKLQIWELTGREKFLDLYKDYVQGAAGGIFVYDITNKSSIKNLDKWIKIFKKTKKSVSIPILMVGNKADLQEKRKISIEHANKLASSRSLIGSIEISAMNKKDVQDLFMSFVKIIKRVDPKRHLVDIFRKELDLRILVLLKIYNELSLTEISYHLGKSKAHISRCTRDLIKLSLLESYTKDDEIQPGNIKRKYYRISQNFDSIMEKKEVDLEKAIKESNWEPLLENLVKYSFEYKKIKMISEQLNNYIEATESQLLTSVAMEELPVIETINLLMEGLERILINFHYLSEKQYEKAISLSSEFHTKLEKVLENDDSSEKPYLYMDMLLPILTIAKSGSKSGLNLLKLRQHALATIKGLNQLPVEKQKELLEPEVLTTIQNIFDRSSLSENKIIGILDKISDRERISIDIFLIEDNLATIHLLTSYFESKGYSCKGVLGDTKGIEELNNFIPKLILMNIILPDLSGYDLCKEIKSDKNLKEIPVYLLSAIPVSEVEKKLEETKVEGYILKPFDFSDFEILFEYL